MKEFLLVALSITYTTSALANICDDDVRGNGGVEGNAYCVYIQGPQNTSQYLKEIDDGKMVITYCINDRMGPQELNLKALKDKSLQTGKYTSIYYQCDSINCDEEKYLASDTYTISAAIGSSEKTIDHNRFGFMLIKDAKTTCTPTDASQFDNYLSYDIPCDKGSYCVPVMGAEAPKKYLQLVSDKGYAITMCSNHLPASTGTEISEGKHEYAFYQCDTIECKNKKALGTDTVIVSKSQQPDHSEHAITLDAAYGMDCTD